MSEPIFYCDPSERESLTYAELIAVLLQPEHAAQRTGVAGWVATWLVQIARGVSPVVYPNSKPRDSQAIKASHLPCDLPTEIRSQASPDPPNQGPTLLQSADANGSPPAGNDWNDLAPSIVAWLQSFTGSIDSLDRQRWQRWWLDSSSQIVLQTSGSSGQPQSFVHSMQSLTRGAQCAPSHAHDVWGWCYPANHLAGMQVLWQALLNGNPLVQLYGQPPNTIHNAIDQYQITHLSCTPTFARLLLTSGRPHLSVQRLTLGGERFDPLLVPALRTMFPQAQLRNIYAATETGPLLISRDDRFEIPPALQPWLQIRNGELWLHKRLRVGQLRVGRAESVADGRLASAPPAESAAESPANENEFWPTGDQVEICSSDPLTIRFLSRKTEGFNVAGFRVDPSRLETIARTHPAVANARFFGVTNSVTEHLVACELVLRELPPTANVDWDPNAFRTWFAGQVARHEVPRIITIVSEIDTTESGKVKRR